jgi:hypothetical protein
MVGSAVPRIVWSSDERNIATMRAIRIGMTLTGGVAEAASPGAPFLARFVLALVGGGAVVLS